MRDKNHIIRNSILSTSLDNCITLALGHLIPIAFSTPASMSTAWTSTSHLMMTNLDLQTPFEQKVWLDFVRNPILEVVADSSTVEDVISIVVS